jgi:hypothetical protein
MRSELQAGSRARKLRPMVVLAALALGLAACGSTGVQIGDGGSGNGDGGHGNGDGQTDSYYWPPAEAGSGDGPIEACAAETTRAQQLPLDIYIMLDQSGSMGDNVTGGTKWTVIRNALAQFLSQPTLTGVSVGLQYFPINNDSCTVNDYATPAVEIAPLSATQQQAIANSLIAHGPTTNTPTGPALQGAINHCKTWGTAHTDHVVITILATDGDPTACTPQDIPSIAAIAATGVAGTPKVLTFVIGVGTSQANMNAIAAGGGTNTAFLVDTGGNVQQQFLDALNVIRGAALGCVYKLPSPDGGTPDYDKVNVQYTPNGTGTPVKFPRVDGLASCPPSGDAWYYDNPSAPTTITLCPSTCTKVKADTTGLIDVLLGCKTILE